MARSQKVRGRMTAPRRIGRLRQPCCHEGMPGRFKVLQPIGLQLPQRWQDFCIEVYIYSMASVDALVAQAEPSRASSVGNAIAARAMKHARDTVEGIDMESDGSLQQHSSSQLAARCPALRLVLGARIPACY